MPDALPMFPLGTVLLPGMVLPLHVFEPRYRALVHDVLGADRRFGVVLIERGQEVGGGDQRTDTGTLAEVAEAQELDDGRWVLVVVGRQRLRVDRWLDDDPYPRAEASPWPDEPADVPADLVADVHARLRRVHALCRELGEDVPEEVALDDDPSTASFQATTLAPVGPLDAQRLLACRDPRDRLAQLADLLDDQEGILRFRLGAGPPP